LAAINAALGAAGIAPIRIPSAAALEVKPPDNGEDLP